MQALCTPEFWFVSTLEHHQTIYSNLMDTPLGLTVAAGAIHSSYRFFHLLNIVTPA